MEWGKGEGALVGYCEGSLRAIVCAWHFSVVKGMRTSRGWGIEWDFESESGSGELR
jgi:hypothetical protein